MVETVVVAGVAGVVGTEEDAVAGCCCFGVAQREAARPGQPAGISLMTLGLGIGPPSTPLRRRKGQAERVLRSGRVSRAGRFARGRVAEATGEGGGVSKPVELTGSDEAVEMGL